MLPCRLLPLSPRAGRGRFASGALAERSKSGEGACPQAQTRASAPPPRFPRPPSPPFGSHPPPPPGGGGGRGTPRSPWLRSPRLQERFIKTPQHHLSPHGLP